MSTDIWGFESMLYPIIDGAGSREETSVKGSFNLGEGILVDYKVINFNKVPLNNQQLVSTSGTIFSLNFRHNTTPFLRFDNEKKGCLHYQFVSGNQTMENHIPLSGNYTLSGLISYSFETLRKTIPWKFPNVQIQDSEGFKGFA